MTHGPSNVKYIILLLHVGSPLGGKSLQEGVMLYLGETSFAKQNMAYFSLTEDFGT